jgi:hypothetical protein
MKIAELLQEEETTLLAGIIASLLKKGEKVVAFAEVWEKDPKKMKPDLYPVARVSEKRVYLKVGQNATTWFELNGDDPHHGDDKMYFKKEGDTWVLAEPKRKFIRT